MAREKTALVLSAGGMYGAYQAGVWQELEGVLNPDVVVGASIGSLNGWMIAGGITGHALMARWLHFDKDVRHRWRVPRLLPTGILDPSHVSSWICAIHEQFEPKCEFGCVTTTMPDMRPRLFKTPNVRCEHLTSSCAIPIVFRHPRIDGVTYCDGGVMVPLPLWAAVEMGATQIVAVNLLPKRPRLLTAAAQALRWYTRWKPDGSADPVELVEISPTKRLGSIRESMYWTRDNAKRWIDLGRADAVAALRNIPV